MPKAQPARDQPGASPCHRRAGVPGAVACSSGERRLLCRAGEGGQTGLRRRRDGGGDLPAPGRPAACARAGGGASESPLAATDPRAARAAAAAVDGGRPRRARAPTDAPGDDRVVVRAADGHGEAPLRQARSLPRRLHPRGGRGGRGGEPGPPAVAGRQEPAPVFSGALLDAGDDRRVRHRATRAVRRC